MSPKQTRTSESYGITIITTTYHRSSIMMNPTQIEGTKERGQDPPSVSEQMHKVAREDVSPGHAPILIKQFTAPPPIFWRSSDGDDIVGLKIELFRYRRRVVIKRAHFITTIVISIYISLTSHQETHRRKARPVHLPYIDALGAPKRAAAAAA